MVLPASLMELYRLRGRTVSCTVSSVDHKLLAEFLNKGYYERHLNKMRGIYNSRHDVLLEELRAFRDICSIHGEHAGVHILLTFHNDSSESELIQKAAGNGVAVYGLSRYYVGEVRIPEQPTVILGYANLKEEEIREAVQRLKCAWLEGAEADEVL